MAVSRQHKLIIISLIFYWTALFILAHIPIPQLVRKADVSDKTLHFLAYMILSVLLFSAINPYKKVNWRKAAVWWVLLIIVWYGVIDEGLQSYVAGRSCDVMDFVANLAGTFTGAILLSVFTFWSVCLVVTGVTIFGLSNIARTNLADLLPGTNTAFHLFAYALFTLLWIRYRKSQMANG
ncbi:MAG: VanZ family protein, partial [Sedimentisphaerales bacterium]